MDADLVNRVVDSARGVLQTETGSPIKMGQVSVQTDSYTSQQVTAIIGVTGSLQGTLMLGLSENTAKQIVSQMMGQEMGSFDDLAQSGIAELGNVIAGAAVTSLAARGYVCTISPPTLVIGSGMTIKTVSIPRLVVPLTTACGTIELQIALRPSAVTQPRAASRACN